VTLRWYALRTVSGYEKKVAEAIKDVAQKNDLSQYFAEVLIPEENSLEIKHGQKRVVKRISMPGYVMVKMAMNDETRSMFRKIPNVKSFLGAGGDPQPISDNQIATILEQLQEKSITTTNRVVFEVGESVKVTDGPFETFTGIVEDVDVEKHRLKVSVSIFGRSTPVELEYSQVTKLDS
jgi:transcriptional antiterminator NusG